MLVWLGGGLVCAAIYLVAVPDSDDPRENRDRAMAAGALISNWPAVLMWLGAVFALAGVAWIGDRQAGGGCPRGGAKGG